MAEASTGVILVRDMLGQVFISLYEGSGMTSGKNVKILIIYRKGH